MTTDRWTDGQMDGQAKNNRAPPTSVGGALTILFEKFGLLSKILTERGECLAEMGIEAVTQPIFLPFCPFNSKYCGSFTIYYKPSPGNPPSSTESLKKPS